MTYAGTVDRIFTDIDRGGEKLMKKSVLLAEEYVRNLKKANLAKRDMDIIRMEIISHILKLEGK